MEWTETLWESHLVSLRLQVVVPSGLATNLPTLRGSRACSML
ncbi:hypothetical protein SynA1560_02030 [Synechococcus sp. A15-60]|nr:hypothetical protein SynA1560_02030 [Synechococcus sp. A15-60]